MTARCTCGCEAIPYGYTIKYYSAKWDDEKGGYFIPDGYPWESVEPMDIYACDKCGKYYGLYAVIGGCLLMEADYVDILGEQIGFKNGDSKSVNIYKVVWTKN